MHRLASALLLLFPALLSGCASSSGRCVDFVALDSAQQRFDAAETVVLARVAETDRTAEDFAVYPVHRATTLRVLKGAAPGAFDVIAPSDQCERKGAPAEYLEGDPLDGVDRAVLYLARDGGTWQLVTPSAVDPFPSGEPLPFDTASPHPFPS